MQNRIVEIASPSSLPHAPGRVLSFAPFVRHLEKRIVELDQRNEADCMKTRFFHYVVEEFKKRPELISGIQLQDAAKYSQQLQLVYNTLSPIIEDEDEQYWSLNWVGSPVMFYFTNGFHRLMTDISTGELKKAVVSTNNTELKKNQQMLNYSIILEKCFNIPDIFSREIIHSLADENTGLVRYYKLNLDTRFIDAHPLGALPSVNISSLLAENRDPDELLAALEKILPAEQFLFEGFGISRIMDVSSRYALENIRKRIFNRSSFEDKDYYTDIVQSLKALIGKKEIEFGLLPVIRVNGKLVFYDVVCRNSRLIRTADGFGIAEKTYLSLADDYLQHPKPVLFTNILDEEGSGNPYLKMLKLGGIRAYALKPVFYNNVLAGVLEIYSTGDHSLDENLLSQLEPAIPLLAQLLQNNIDEFNNSIIKVIKEKFTAVQPAVEWKFNEVAWRYLQESRENPEQHDIEEIGFENVHPLYGSIDIRNSTIERNIAMQKDLRRQFSVLIRVLQELKQKSGFGLLDEKIFSAQKWEAGLGDERGVELENELNEFLEYDISPFLLQFVEGNQEYETIVQEYFEAINEETGIAFENRRQMEVSMGIVISAVNKYLENVKNESQQAYPCYFEKFRTDGVEYDIYIGQSIAPDRPFNEIYLKNLRLLQLTSMSAIAKNTHKLQQQLARPVETTQLIFIHSHPIDIRFRKDEKRFDVEGAYNIRYHIVKKRIDKVLVKGTDERLTQPGMIAMVYFNQKEADEYISYIQFLQGEKILKEGLEHLELEDLQGVSGLKAMRVEVNLVDG